MSACVYPVELCTDFGECRRTGATELVVVALVSDERPRFADRAGNRFGVLHIGVFVPPPREHERPLSHSTGDRQRIVVAIGYVVFRISEAILLLTERQS